MAAERNRPVPRRLAIAGMAGNILEWYDFSIYGFFAPAIGEAFFPSHNPATSLIDAAIVSAIFALTLKETARAPLKT